MENQSGDQMCAQTVRIMALLPPPATYQSDDHFYTNQMSDHVIKTLEYCEEMIICGKKTSLVLNDMQKCNLIRHWNFEQAWKFMENIYRMKSSKLAAVFFNDKTASSYWFYEIMMRLEVMESLLTHDMMESMKRIDGVESWDNL